MLMNYIGVSFIIIGFIFTSLFIFWIVFLLHGKKTKEKLNTRRGTIVLRFNPNTKQINPYVLDGDTNKNDSNSTINVSRIFNLFSNNEHKKMFKNAISEATNRKSEIIEYTFNSLAVNVDNGKVDLKFFVSFKKIDDSQEYVINIIWNEIIEELKGPSIRSISEVTILKNPNNYFGFVSFSLNQYVPNCKNKFLHVIKDLLNDEFDHFEDSGLMIFIYNNAKEKNVIKKTEYFIKNIKKLSKKISIKTYIHGTSQHIASNLTEKKDINKVIAQLDYLTSLSQSQKKSFIKFLDDKKFQLDFLNYYKARQEFRDLIKTQNVRTKTLDIYSVKGDKKTFKYTMPDIEYHKYKLVMFNTYYYRSLVNAIIENKIEQKEEGNELTLIDVNSSWIIKKSSKLKNKKNVYIINLENYDQINEIIKVSSVLRSKEILLGLRIKNINDFTISLIKSSLPSLLIIDSKLTFDVSSIGAESIKVSTLKTILEETDIKIIFEDLSTKLNNDPNKGLRLKYKNDFYYDRVYR